VDDDSQKRSADYLTPRAQARAKINRSRPQYEGRVFVWERKVQLYVKWTRRVYSFLDRSRRLLYNLANLPDYSAGKEYNESTVSLMV
jgi:23S rRNA G2445 N2-methylase RlmL